MFDIFLLAILLARGVAAVVWMMRRFYLAREKHGSGSSLDLFRSEARGR